MLVQYVRRNGQPCGCVVALDRNVIGWSECNPRDRFCKKRGKEIAIGRAQTGTNSQPLHPETYEVLELINRRSETYFKPDYKVIE